MPEFESTQFLAKATGEKKPDPTENVGIKADEHGVIKTTGEKTVPANQPLSTAGKVGATNKPPATVSAAKPNPAAAKSSASNPSTLLPGKLGIVDISTESDHSQGVAVTLKRSDGVKLQFPFTLRDKEDLYGVKNMFDLIGKIINLPEEELREKFPTFVYDK